MLKYDQFLLESKSGKTFGEMKDAALESYKKIVKELILSKINEIVKEYTLINSDNSQFLILEIETEDKFSIIISFNQLFNMVEYYIIDNIIDKSVYDARLFNTIESFSKDLEKRLTFIRSNDYKSKRIIQKFKL